MKIAILQAEAEPLAPERNLEAIREAAEAARAQGAELLLAPELFVTGYAPRELAGWLTPERIAGFPSALSRIAASAGIAVASGLPLARPDGTFAIAAGLWDASGTEVLRYEKVHLWGEDEPLAFTPSEAAPEVADWNGRRVGFQICYDIEFPEPARLLAERGADLVLVPTAIDATARYVPEVLVRARAAENGIVVAYADHAGPDAERERSADQAGAADQAGPADSAPEPRAGFAGLSIVAGELGAVFGAAGEAPELLIAEIPDPPAKPLSAEGYLRDRRPDLYSTWR